MATGDAHVEPDRGGDREVVISLDTINDCMVSVQGMPGLGTVQILNPPIGPMQPDRALRLAAWLAVCADPGGEQFAAVLAAVRNT